MAEINLLLSPNKLFMIVDSGTLMKVACDSLAMADNVLVVKDEPFDV